MAKVLIVENHAHEAMSYKLVLESQGTELEAIIANNENEAKDILGKEIIDVIVSDLVMLTPQSGMDVLRMAKEKDPFLMVILVTAYGTKLDRDRAFELGAFDCILKNTPGVKTAKEILATDPALNGCNVSGGSCI